jgi:uncharacterized protein (TIGR03435 family)
LGVPVSDATGLGGTYDIDMVWGRESMGLRGGVTGGEQRGGTPTVPDSRIGPTLNQAVQEQLGLKLNPAKVVADISWWLTTQRRFQLKTSPSAS